MIARRMPPVNGQPQMPILAGDLTGPTVGWAGDLPVVLFLKPNAQDLDAPDCARWVHQVTSPPFTFVEEDDGTLSILEPLEPDFPSGMDEDGRTIVLDDGWRGYLTRGLWRKA